MQKAILLVIFLGTALCVGSGCEKQPDASTEQPEAKSASIQDEKSEEPGQKPTVPSESEQSPRTLEDLPEGVNAVQNEMRVLNSAMQEILTLIANDTLEGIPAQIKRVHPARQLTMKAVEQGKYEPPVNADKMGEFEKLDNQFHDDLKALIAASKKDDLQAATDSYADLVHGCTNCHTKFRFAPGDGPAPGTND